MKNMKKVELIIESVYTPRLLKLFENHDIDGYTLIKDIEGVGGHGIKSADDVSDVFSNIYIFTLCEAEKYDDMDKDIRKFLNKYGGKCILSDVTILLGSTKKNG
jgi:hypothetical protein